MPRKRITPAELSGRAIIRRRIVWRVVCIPSRAAKRVPPLREDRQPNGGDLLTVPDRHPGPGFHKSWETFSEYFTLDIRGLRQ